MMLYRLLSKMNSEEFPSQVINLTGVGPMEEKIEALGVPVDAADMSHGIPDPRGVLRVARRIRRIQPQVIQTWMYHADLIGGLAARLAGKTPVVWGIHHSNLAPRYNRRTTIWTAGPRSWSPPTITM